MANKGIPTIVGKTSANFVYHLKHLIKLESSHQMQRPQGHNGAIV